MKYPFELGDTIIELDGIICVKSHIDTMGDHVLDITYKTTVLRVGFKIQGQVPTDKKIEEMQKTLKYMVFKYSKVDVPAKYQTEGGFQTCLYGFSTVNSVTCENSICALRNQCVNNILSKEPL